MNLNLRLALGFAVAVVAIFCIVVIASVREMTFYERYHRGAGIALTAIGAGTLMFGIWRRRRTAPAPVQAKTEAGDGEMVEEASPFDLRYFGLLSGIIGLVTIFILPLERKPVVRAAEPPPARPVKTNPPPEAPAPVVAFPTIRVQGIFYRPDRPSALISRQTCFVGDVVEGAKVIAISRDSVTLELSGEKRVFHLEP